MLTLKEIADQLKIVNLNIYKQIEDYRESGKYTFMIPDSPFIMEWILSDNINFVKQLCFVFPVPCDAPEIAAYSTTFAIAVARLFAPNLQENFLEVVLASDHKNVTFQGNPLVKVMCHGLLYLTFTYDISTV